MTTEKDKLIQFVIKLIELTQDGKINWYARSDSSISSFVPSPSPVYETSTKYGDKHFRLYYKRANVVIGTSSPPSGAGFKSILGKQEQDIYPSGICLEIIDDAGNNLWTFPEVSGLSDLYEAVRYRVAGVKSIIDSVLGEKKD